MNDKPAFIKNKERLFASSIALLIGIALVLQCVGMEWKGIQDLFNLGSYFTISTIGLIGIATTLIAFDKNWLFLRKEGFLVSLCHSIALIALFYNLIFRIIIFPEDLLFLADNLFHVFIPVLYFIFTVWFLPKDSWRLSQFFGWLIYPTCYYLLVIGYGELTDFYPYPFLNHETHGWVGLGFNYASLLILFFVISVFINRIAWVINRFKKENDVLIEN